MAVDRDYTVKDFGLIDAFVTPINSSAGTSGISGGNTLLQGSIARTGAGFGRTATVKAGEDIRPALESLRSAGGGTLILLAGTHRPTYDIVGGSKINIIGEGEGQTIIDFVDGGFGLRCVGTDAQRIKNFIFRDFTISNSNALAGLFVNHAAEFNIQNVTVDSCSQNGIIFDAVREFTISDISSEFNTGDGFQFRAGVLAISTYFSVISCQSAMNSGHGFYFYDNSSGIVWNSTFTNCRAIGNSLDGYYFDSLSTATIGLTFLSCLASLNRYGFFSTATSLRLGLYGCTLDANSSGGLNLSGENYNIFGGQSSDPVTLNAGGTCLGFFTTGGATTFGTTDSIEIRMRADSPKEVRRTMFFRNVSGSTQTAGSVVIWGTAAGGDEYTTTTVAGNERVLGVVNNTTPNTFLGYVMVEGFITTLKVNGVTDIAVGDFLSTHTVAGIAARGLAGHMVFAIALEAYTANDSLGVIDALIISPRKI